MIENDRIFINLYRLIIFYKFISFSIIDRASITIFIGYKFHHMYLIIKDFIRFVQDFHKI